MISKKSFAGEVTPRLVAFEYVECNFVIKTPAEEGGLKVGIRMFPGDDTPRTFTRCNLINRIVPPGSTLVQCNTAIIDYNALESTDEVVVDGETISIENRRNIAYGRYVDGVAEYFSEPSLGRIQRIRD